VSYEVFVLEAAAEFLRGLEPKLRAKALRTIELLRQFGPQLPMPHSRRIAGHDLYELRTRFGSNISRMFYFHHSGRLYVVSSGFVKKTDRTSRQEIERAARLKDSYEGGSNR
jgi:phage-related protein